ncbi:juxtaposed with another zinc finger protein 1-like isoform X2 [Ruditapes philippinarum]|uniref:juxtaposed with another zinc finger protein 1-like isoform X2 n=1 Tax=Ruditapes philippinarum TaxID=129788 RepID=UPI00295AE431|nr:juxtaposed with another zinc finger protein 1-like isoform X2 [Ruditapes philippinarum]
MQMAVFLLNNCKFQGCGRAFSSLADLIHHIEDSHIDADPKILEKQEGQQPPSLALSYILKHFAKGVPIRKDADHKKKAKSRVPSPPSIRSSTPTSSDLGDDDDICSEDEDSDDSYTTQEEFTTELILGMMQNLKDGDVDKPFACPVPGCKKRYKNVNGMKYHARHGHRKDSSLFCRVKKAFKCKCGKSYRTAQKLRAHMIVKHSTTDLLKQTTPVTLSTTVTPSSQQVSSSPLMTNAIFSVPPSVAQSALATGTLTQTSLNLVPVTVTTTKQGQITLASTGATLQLIGCPQTEMMTSVDMKSE